MATTTAKLKHDIDRGRAGDKVAVIDPAAVPLGTGDEAAGTPPTPRVVEQAHQDESAQRLCRRSGMIATMPWPSTSASSA